MHQAECLINDGLFEACIKVSLYSTFLDMSQCSELSNTLSYVFSCSLTKRQSFNSWNVYFSYCPWNYFTSIKGKILDAYAWAQFLLHVDAGIYDTCGLNKVKLLLFLLSSLSSVFASNPGSHWLLSVVLFTPLAGAINFKWKYGPLIF